MKPNIIPRSKVVSVIADALEQFAQDMDAKLASNLESVAWEACMRRLSAVLGQHESSPLARLIAEPRIECADCKSGVGYTRASGAFCLSCAKRRQEAAQRTPVA